MEGHTGRNQKVPPRSLMGKLLLLRAGRLVIIDNVVEARPARFARWDDIVSVLGPQGSYRGCWCLYWRLKRSEIGRLGTPGHSEAFRKPTDNTGPPRLLYYDIADNEAGIPFGWFAVGPRGHFPVLRRSPMLTPVDEAPTWPLVCFYLTRRVVVRKKEYLIRRSFIRHIDQS